MDFLQTLLVALHILGAAAIFGGWLATFKTPTVTVWQFAGAIVQVVTGLALVGLAEAGPDPVNHIKIAVKTVFAVIVLVAAIIGYRKVRKDEPVSKGLAHAVGGMAFINILVATLWH
ncbi:hypothetical protein [Galactobacter caseinivorans]|uniref:Fe-S protein n=1 Tax=Galactobacter caseinivorans TaxID=2676123 RepID=A0A496PMJ6_9MICC|nr:hypothetical protein [Galactobacter caseinivorans]RKW71689.1 hypothetical protein DWQ67_02320 [Galactobacter caseinivorans]